MLSNANCDRCTTSRLVGASPLGSAGVAAAELEADAEACARDDEPLLDTRTPSANNAIWKDPELRMARFVRQGEEST